MTARSTRRTFLCRAAGTGGALGFSSLANLNRIVADKTANDAPAEPPIGRPWAVRYDDEIEPLVRVIEDTPLDKCVEELAVRVRRGMTYRQFLTALFLAGLRNGGDFGYYHCIYMLHSAHQLTLDAPAADRLIALFAALGVFKGWQKKRYDGNDHFGWRKPPTKLPDADKASSQFRSAISSSDPDAAEAAMIVLYRTSSQSALFDRIIPYTLANGVHGWICLANLFRIFPAIGSERAEPALRMMARGYAADRHWSETWLAPRIQAAQKKFAVLPRGWSDARGDKSATLDVLAALREGDPEATFQRVYQQLAAGELQAGSIWDAIHLAAAERFVLSGGDGNALHMNTGMNALHYAFRATADSRVRRMTLLRGVAWTSEPFGIVRGVPDSKTIVRFAQDEVAADPQVAAEEILATPATDGNVVGKALAFAQRHADSQALWQAQRGRVVRRASDAHPYKYLAAIWENARHVSAHYRPLIAASSLAGNTGKPPPEAPVISLAREALRET